LVVAGLGAALALGCAPASRADETGPSAGPVLVSSVVSAEATLAAPFSVQLGFSDPVLAGRLTIRDSSGAVVGSVSTGNIILASIWASWTPEYWLPSQVEGQPNVWSAAPAGTYSWTYTAVDESGEPALNEAGDGPPSGTFTVRACRQFADVPPSHTFYRPICWAEAAGVTVGAGDGSVFLPGNPVNRGAMAAFLYRMVGSPEWVAPAVSPFVDVPVDHTFYKPITWLYDQGITVGVTVGGQLYYQPSNAVSRGSMTAFLSRLVGNRPGVGATMPFADVPVTHPFYWNIRWAAAYRIAEGYTSGGQLLFGPGTPVNRGAMTAFLSRLPRSTPICVAHPTAVGCWLI
jgi:hypothetical protein